MQFFPFSSHTTFPLQVPTSPCPLQVLLQELNIPKLQTPRNGVHFPPSCACDALGPRPRAVLRLVDALPQGATLEGLQALGARLGGVTSPQDALGHSQGLQLLVHPHQAPKVGDFCNSGHGCMGKGK